MGAVFKLQASVIHRHLISIIIIMDTKIIFCLLLAVVITSALPAAEMNQDKPIAGATESTASTGSTDTPTGSTDKSPTGSTDKSTATTTTITATTSGSTTTNFSLTTL